MKNKLFMGFMIVIVIILFFFVGKNIYENIYFKNKMINFIEENYDNRGLEVTAYVENKKNIIEGIPASYYLYAKNKDGMEFYTEISKENKDDIVTYYSKYAVEFYIHNEIKNLTGIDLYDEEVTFSNDTLLYNDYNSFDIADKLEEDANDKGIIFEKYMESNKKSYLKEMAKMQLNFQYSGELDKITDKHFDEWFNTYEKFNKEINPNVKELKIDFEYFVKDKDKWFEFELYKKENNQIIYLNKEEFIEKIKTEISKDK